MSYHYYLELNYFHTLGTIFGECDLSGFDVGGGVFGGTGEYHDPYYRAGVTVTVAAASSRMQQTLSTYFNFINKFPHNTAVKGPECYSKLNSSIFIGHVDLKRQREKDLPS